MPGVDEFHIIKSEHMMILLRLRLKPLRRKQLMLLLKNYLPMLTFLHLGGGCRSALELHHLQVRRVGRRVVNNPLLLQSLKSVLLKRREKMLQQKMIVLTNNSLGYALVLSSKVGALDLSSGLNFLVRVKQLQILPIDTTPLAPTTTEARTNSSIAQEVVEES